MKISDNISESTNDDEIGDPFPMEEFDKFWDRPSYLNIGSLTLFFLFLFSPNKLATLNQVAWRDYFPLNQMAHPGMDTYHSDETIVSNAGFQLKKHFVTTEDGYINYLANVRDNKEG